MFYLILLDHWFAVGPDLMSALHCLIGATTIKHIGACVVKKEKQNVT